MRSFYLENAKHLFPPVMTPEQVFSEETEEMFSGFADILPDYFAMDGEVDYNLQILDMKMTAYFQPEPLVEKLCLYPIVVTSNTLSATHFTRRNGWRCYQLGYTTQGRGMLHFGGKSYPLEKDSFFLIDCNQPHYFHADDPAGWGYDFVHFAGASMQYLFPQVTKNGCCFPEQKNTRAYRRFYQIFDIARDVPSDFDLQAHCLLTELMMELSGSLTLPEAEVVPEWLSKIRAYITENYNQTLNLKDLADMAYLSQSRFSHKFKAATGVSPIEYQYQLRISRACELLEHTDQTVQQIAAMVGFANETNFYGKFHSATGSTPSAWRKQKKCGQVKKR